MGSTTEIYLLLSVYYCYYWKNHKGRKVEGLPGAGDAFQGEWRAHNRWKMWLFELDHGHITRSVGRQESQGDASQLLSPFASPLVTELIGYHRSLNNPISELSPRFPRTTPRWKRGSLNSVACDASKNPSSIALPSYSEADSHLILTPEEMLGWAESTAWCWQTDRGWHQPWSSLNPRKWVWP